ncbi:MAG: glycosyltransferase family 39 protein, partial [Candidatus Hermodarchaeota archaeon]
MNFIRVFNSRNLLYIFLSISIYLRLINIISEQLWEDEAISIAIATSSNSSFWTKVIGDIHPPLYYIILRGWILIFGKSIFSVRLLSVLFSILTLPILYLIGKEIINENLGLIIIFLYSISPFSIFFANEVRSYSLIHFLFTLSLYFAIKCLKSPENVKNYIYLSVVSVS